MKLAERKRFKLIRDGNGYLRHKIPEKITYYADYCQVHAAEHMTEVREQARGVGKLSTVK